MYFALLSWTGPAHLHPHQRRQAGAWLRNAARALAAAWLGLQGTAQAAGGHHAVDDAAVLAPGQCQAEVWFEQADERRLVHVGPACRLGGVELGLNLDDGRQRGTPELRSIGPQVKWVTELLPTLSVGAVWGATWQNVSTHSAGQSLLVPLTWTPHPDVAVHLNLGRDLRPQGRDLTRRGAALEWKPSPQWQGLAEWFDDGLSAHRRLGLRRLISADLSLDLSRAAPVGRTSDAWWTVGLNWTFAR
jgi:hypothetical protein